MRKRVYSDYIQDILDAVADVEEFVSGLSFEDFKRDKKTLYAVIRGIEVIGEATKNIPNTIRDRYTDVPWKDMAGMRDKLIHDYSGVDAEVLWKTVEQDLPLLRASVSKIMKELKEEQT